jgi:agmatinase
MAKQFNPSSAATHDAGIFGLPCVSDEARIILIPVNWELTVSYGKGTCHGPDAIKSASMQVDLYNHNYPSLWEHGIWLDEFPASLKLMHKKLRHDAEAIIDAIEEGTIDTSWAVFQTLYKKIFEGGEQLNQWVKDRVAYWKSKGKIVGLIGGDHSTPLGYHHYLTENQVKYGILTVDAHMDLRKAYEGFEYSHASIFYNVLQLDSVEKIVQLGIRDYSHEEMELLKGNNRVVVFFDRDIRKQMYEGKTWQYLVDEIIGQLPEKVYVSIDIDGLDPKLCPHTGTPVPGGLQFEELMYLLNRLKISGKEIIGFDLCEVAPNPIDISDEWDGNVGARVLFQLCGIAI